MVRTQPRTGVRFAEIIIEFTRRLYADFCLATIQRETTYVARRVAGDPALGGRVVKRVVKCDRLPTTSTQLESPGNASGHK